MAEVTLMRVSGLARSLSMNLGRRFASLMLCGVVIGMAALNAQTAHVNRDHGWANGAITNMAVDERIRAAAREYGSRGSIPRIALYDVAYPKDCAELKATGGYGVLVVTALVHDKTELPLPRVYLRSSAGETSLVLIGWVASQVAESDALVRDVFGGFRLDAAYPMPAWVTGVVLADFAAHRQEFRLAQAAEVPTLRGCGTIRAGVPVEDRVWALFGREYPDLSRTLSAR